MVAAGSDPATQPVNPPAVCGTCGTIFPSGFIAAGGSSFFLNSQAGPCPGCGSMGRLPDGVVDLTRPDVVAALRAMVQLGSIDNLRIMISLLSAASADELIAIRQALTTGTGQRSEDQVVHDVQRAAPRLVGVAGLIRNRDNRIELATWLTLLATIIPIVIAIKASHPEVSPPRQEQIIQCIAPAPKGIPTTPGHAGQRKRGRNDPGFAGTTRRAAGRAVHPAVVGETAGASVLLRRRTHPDQLLDRFGAANHRLDRVRQDQDARDCGDCQGRRGDGPLPARGP
jgi:hypothetical protein